MAKKSVGLIELIVPELFGRSGGIARICRSLALAFAQYGEREGIAVSVRALNDDGVRRDDRYVPDSVSYTGYSGNRLQLARDALVSSARSDHLLSIFGHVNLASIGLLFPIRKPEPSRRYVILTHGVEVWTPLQLHRRLALRNAAEIWSVSAYSARQIEDLHGVRDGSLRVLHNCLDPYFDGDVPPGTPAERASSFVLCVSRLAGSERYKGVDTAIAALARIHEEHPTLRLKIVGAGDDLPRLETLAERLGIAPQVDFLGAVSDERLLALYRDCLFFTLPSRKEGFGLVYLEAMARAKAVVAADSGGTPEVVVSKSSGILVPYGDEARLAAAFSQLASSAHDRERMGREGLLRLDQRFRFEHYRRNIFRLLDGMVKPHLARQRAES